MAKVLVTDTHLTNIADAIRGKKGTSDTYKPSEMANAISNIETGIEPIGTLDITENGTYDVTEYATANVNIANDTSEIEDAFISHTISGDYANDRVTKVKYGTFYEDSKLTSISLPNVTSVESYAFYKCTSLDTINAPKLQSASSYTFAYTILSNINFPLLTTISTYTFAYINTPCSVCLPSLTTVPNSGFRDSKGITSVDLASATKIDTLAFYYCNKLEKLILRKQDTICTLTNTNAFTGTPIKNGTGYIYVPDDLVETYKSATNWSSFASQIKPLSELAE